MSENLRALIVILVLATAFFAFARRYVCTIAGEGDFARRRNLWLALTLAAFVVQNFWLYTLIAVPLLIYANRRESNPAAMYFFLLFVLPVAYVEIPGMGLVNFIFDLSHARILELLILLPALLVLRRQEGNLSYGRTGADKALAAYLLLTVILRLREPSFTDTLRFAFYQFIDVFLPYFVISRSLKNMQDFRDALLSLVLAIMLLAPIAIFEFSKHWLLYSYVTEILKLEGGMTGYLGRENMLRAITTAGQPIALGYLMVAGIGLYLFVQHSIEKKLVRRIGLALLAAGLIAPLSRGPWVGIAVLFTVLIVTGRYPARLWINTALATMLVLPLLTIIPGSQKMINLLPFIGTTEADNVDYRERLITNSMIVIQRNLWFGSINYLRTPEMESMRQGQGIIDIVNTYVIVALQAGIVGLGLFIGFFALTLQGIYRALRSISDRNSEEYLLGRALLATLLALLVIIFTVSNITVIPMIYWSVAALGVAYAQMVRKSADLIQNKASMTTNNKIDAV